MSLYAEDLGIKGHPFYANKEMRRSIAFLSALFPPKIWFMRKYLSTGLKIGISILGVAYVLWNVPFDKLAEQFQDIQWSWFVWAGILLTLGIGVRAYRWLLLLRGVGVQVSYLRLLEIYFIGNFFNSFLPTGFGGDVIRAFEAAQDVPSEVSAGTVLVDRMTGLLALFAMALCALPFRPEAFPNQMALLVAGICLVGLIGGFLVLDGRFPRLFLNILPTALARPLNKVMAAVAGCGWTAVWGALASSLFLNLMLIGWWSAAGKSLGHDISYGYYILVVPILSVALLAPSFGGLGVREVIAPILFAGAGLNDAEAVTLSLMVFIITRVFSLLGAPIYLLSSLRNRQIVEKSLDEPSLPI